MTEIKPIYNLIPGVSSRELTILKFLCVMESKRLIVLIDLWENDPELEQIFAKDLKEVNSLMQKLIAAQPRQG